MGEKTYYKMNRVFHSYIPFLWYHIGVIYKHILPSNFTYFEIKYTFMIISALGFLTKHPFLFVKNFQLYLIIEI